MPRRAAPAARLIGVMRRDRRALLLGTALQASGLLVLMAPRLAAQPAPNARPMGGSIVAGTAAISQAPGVTTIDQSSQRAAIDWQSFDVGARQTVQFNQPSPRAATLNRVTGPNPSQIAGRINANGTVVLVNQDGVYFSRGAQVNAAGFVASAAGITNRNFMAGKMVFDQPAHPNAKVSNAGTLTIRQAGLAALVAPQVANSGVITAKLGHVVLAGGVRAATLDMYGDGLVSIDVTKEVEQVPVGPGGRKATALVTNSGVVVADGGTVQLTARAADGIVQTLVQAGGTIAADSAGARTGVVAIQGVGGDVVVSGRLLAEGRAAGTHGGAVVVNGDGAVRLAAHAVIDASGDRGGGVVALGTTLRRARGGPAVTARMTARKVIVESGAIIRANAIGTGSGGRVSVLSREATAFAGTIEARGGRNGGDGGFAEISGGGAYALNGGQVDLTAPHGSVGTLLLDPDNLTIVAGNTLGNVTPYLPPITLVANGAISVLGAGTLAAYGKASNVSVVASGSLDVAVNVSVANGLRLQAGTDLNVGSAGSQVAIVAGGGDCGGLLDLAAGGALNLLHGSVLQAPSISLAGAEINLGAARVDAGGGSGSLLMRSAGSVSQAGGGALVAGILSASTESGSIALLAAGNRIAALGTIAVHGGSLDIRDAVSLAVPAASMVFADNVSIADRAGMTVLGSIGAGGANLPGTIALSAGANGSIVIGGSGSTPLLGALGKIVLSAPGGSVIQGSGLVNADAVTAAAAGVIQNGGTIFALAAPGLSLAASGSIAQAGGLLASGGAMSLAAGNGITLRGGLVASGNVGLSSDAAIVLAAPTIAAGGNLTAGGIATPKAGRIEQRAGTVSAGNILRLSATAGAQTGGVAVGDVEQIDAPGFTDFGARVITVGAPSGAVACPCTTGPPADHPIAPALTIQPYRPYELAITAPTIAIGTPLVADQVRLTSTAGGIAEGAGGAIDSLLLSGAAAGDVSLSGPANAIAALGDFTAAGNFLLRDDARPGQTLIVAGSVQAGESGGKTLELIAPALAVVNGPGASIVLAGTASPPNPRLPIEIAADGSLLAGPSVTGNVLTPGQILLEADALRVLGPGTAPIVAAPSGLVAIAPYTAGSVMTIAPVAGSALQPGTIAANDLALISTMGGPSLTPGPLGTETLAFGSLDDGASSIRAGGIVIEAPLRLGSVASTLGLFAAASSAPGSGMIAQGPGDTIAVPMLTGAAGVVGGAAVGTGPTGIDLPESNAIGAVGNSDMRMIGGAPVVSAASGQANLVASGSILLRDGGNLLVQTTIQAGDDPALSFAHPVLGGVPTETADIAAAGTLTVSGAVIAGSAGTLRGNLILAGSDVALDGGAFPLLGGNASITATAGSIEIPGIVWGDLTAAGPPAGTVTLVAAHQIDEPGLIGAQVLAGSSGWHASLTGGNLIQGLGPFSSDTAAGDPAPGLTLHDGAGMLTIAGAVGDAAGPVTVAVAPAGGAGPGDLVIAAPLAAATRLDVQATGTVYETAAGVVTAANAVLKGDAIAAAGVLDVADMLSLTSAHDTALDGVVTTGGLSVATGGTLRDGGMVTAANAALTAGAISIPGTLDVTGILNLLSAGPVDANGVVAAGLLTGAADGDVSLTGANHIALIDNLLVGSATPPRGLTVHDDSNLVLGGIIAAWRQDFSASPPYGIALAGGTVIDTGGTARPPSGQPVPLTGGAHFSDFVQLGAVDILSLGGPGAPNTVVIDALPGQNIAFAANGGFYGPATWLVAEVAGNSAISGNIFVRSFDVIYSGTGGSSALFGTVGPATGIAAAMAANIAPKLNPDFLLNSCPIHSTTCVLFPVLTLPVGNPLENYSLSGSPDSGNPDDLLLPIVSDKEY